MQLKPLSRLLGPKPHISESPYLSLIPKTSSPGMSAKVDLSTTSYYVVASVEMGNTTTKCILTATNLETGKTYLLNKTVKMSRDVRPPKEGEKVFGKTLDGKKLTRESVGELVKQTLEEAHNAAGLTIKEDLNFVVRSTGVVAGFARPDDVGTFILALADGCIKAGVPPKNMTPAMNKENLNPRIRKFSYLDKVFFDGAVASVLPPMGSTGVEIVANEMEGELATAGIKEAAKWAGVDFRNPVCSIDFGTTLKGRITNDGFPYAKTIGNYCGLAGAIPDAIVRGSGLVDRKFGNVLDITKHEKPGLLTEILNDRAIEEHAKWAHELIQIEVVPDDRNWWGTVPVNPRAARNNGVILIGCEVGENGKDLPLLNEVGASLIKKYNVNTMLATLDLVSAMIAERLLKKALENNLISSKTTIGITGRAGITGDKPALILQKVAEMGLFENPNDHLVFCDDGLARGAAVMARCMNSLGTPKNPLGGQRGGKCIMGARMKLQNAGKKVES
ncbi:putative methanogenesis marker protein 14 [Methanocella conradii HZ254]|uniref:Methanogenesis marker protein 14 n=1 Tax=Methanocella conradii (strain DSM 24694 / JCM 17849 / CGMCC 1.5162 / HZ254) TaxID=1041930 RepID=H8I4E6_METCZ|nr:methanogenesis marker 14 protein [Methanocella conradii]AFC99703.1 putative methanogenesis marker protein 14 [Methanocella conradii HZ254]MDI6896582.1 methanogenesis marker 14 protein [Methanocella conradii]